MNQIEKLQRTIGILSAAVSLKNLSKIPVVSTEIKSANISKGCNQLGISKNELDVLYYSTDFDTWQEIIEVVWGILKNFTWTADRADCDNRSNFVTSMVSILFGLNTCAGMYTKVTNINTGATDMHWANCIIDKDGNMYAFDADNNGLMQKITSNGFIMGVWKYDVVNLRIY